MAASDVEALDKRVQDAGTEVHRALSIILGEFEDGCTESTGRTDLECIVRQVEPGGAKNCPRAPAEAFSLWQNVQCALGKRTSTAHPVST